jgi:hypothetical protein
MVKPGRKMESERNKSSLADRKSPILGYPKAGLTWPLEAFFRNILTPKVEFVVGIGYNVKKLNTSKISKN